MARRILFMSQKGGVGKSTLARSAAIALVKKGRRVLLADFDQEQGTCLRWRAQRQARNLVPLVDTQGFEKVGKLKKAQRGYEDVVIDTPGRLDEASLELANTAHSIFLPSSFSLDDILPTLKMIERLRQRGTPASHIAIIFCRTGGSTAQEKQVRSILTMNSISTFEAGLQHKDGYTSLYATGRVGAESPNKHLRNAALAVDDELLGFVNAYEAVQMSA